MTDKEKNKANNETGMKLKVGFAASLPLISIIVSVVLAAALYMAWSRVGELEAGQATLQKNQKQFVEQASGRIGKILDLQKHQLQKALQLQSGIIMQLQKELQQVRIIVSRDRNGWLLAEAGYLLKTADSRLQLHRDVATAIVALQMAAARIKSINKPELKPLLVLVENEIKLLQAVKPSGQEHVLEELLKAEQAVDGLALKTVMTFRRKEAASKEGTGFLSDLWGQLKTLVVIRRHDRKYQPILTREEQRQVRQVLKLKLVQARTALASGQQDYFRKLLSDMKNWLQQYFSETDKKVMAIKKMLAGLEDYRVNRALPETGKALEWLQVFNARKVTSRTPPADKKPVGKAGPARAGNKAGSK